MINKYLWYLLIQCPNEKNLGLFLDRCAHTTYSYAQANTHWVRENGITISKVLFLLVSFPLDKMTFLWFDEREHTCMYFSVFFALSRFTLECRRDIFFCFLHPGVWMSAYGLVALILFLFNLCVSTDLPFPFFSYIWLLQVKCWDVHTCLIEE